MNTAAPSKYDDYLSAARDFSGGPYAPALRYLICSSARCGSTLMGQMLKDTGVAGDPLEFLNPSFVAAFSKRTGAQNLGIDPYVKALEAMRTSPNGRFGMQVHYSRFVRVFGQDEQAGMRFIRHFDKFIFLRRKDKLAQAVSIWRADLTQLWSSIDEDRRSTRSAELDAVFDPKALMERLSYLVAQDTAWAALLKKHQLPFIELYYEDLIAQWAEKSAEILHFLGAAVPQTIPAPALRKQSPEDDAVLKQFRAYLG